MARRRSPKKVEKAVEILWKNCEKAEGPASERRGWVLGFGRYFGAGVREIHRGAPNQSAIVAGNPRMKCWRERGLCGAGKVWRAAISRG
jgi:hypothetical protein